jgi:hypothetical protein
MTSYIDNLKAARDRYAQELASRQGPPDVRWDEYEAWLVEQIGKLDEQIRSAGDDPEVGGSRIWVVSQGAT